MLQSERNGGESKSYNRHGRDGQGEREREERVFYSIPESSCLMYLQVKNEKENRYYKFTTTEMDRILYKWAL